MEPLVRITQKEKEIIKSVIFNFDQNATIKLFGSRIYDEKKGGDIDLYVETKKNFDLDKKIQILTELEFCGISRKIDLIVKTPYTKYLSIFDTINKEGIIL